MLIRYNRSCRRSMCAIICVCRVRRSITHGLQCAPFWPLGLQRPLRQNETGKCALGIGYTVDSWVHQKSAWHQLHYDVVHQVRTTWRLAKHSSDRSASRAHQQQQQQHGQIEHWPVYVSFMSSATSSVPTHLCMTPLYSVCTIIILPGCLYRLLDCLMHYDLSSAVLPACIITIKLCPNSITPTGSATRFWAERG